MSAKPKTYRTLMPVLHSGEMSAIGAEISLRVEDAATLLLLGAIEEIATATTTKESPKESTKDSAKPVAEPKPEAANATANG